MMRDTGIYHVFTCVLCRAQYTMHRPKKDPLSCFFFGVCYWCARKHDLKFEDVQHAVDTELKSREETLEHGC